MRRDFTEQLNKRSKPVSEGGTNKERIEDAVNMVRDLEVLYKRFLAWTGRDPETPSSDQVWAVMWALSVDDELRTDFLKYVDALRRQRGAEMESDV